MAYLSKIKLLNLLILFFSANYFNLNGQDLPDGQTAWSEISERLNRIILPDFPARDYSVENFGAIGDGKADCYNAFKEAIRVCNADGGGRVVIPAGNFLINGPIHLKSNVNLHFEEGSVIKFGPNPSDYLPAVLTCWEGTELFNYSPLIYAYQASRVAITGAGTIDGNASAGFANWKPKQKEAQSRLRQMGNDGVPVYERVFGEGDFLRPAMVQFYGCKYVLVEGVTIKDSPFWCLHPVFCTGVTIKQVTVESRNQNNDGCDPDASVDVLIEDCVFRTGDDGIAIKSGRDQDGWRIGQASENVIIRNCRIDSKINGLCIGSEMSGSVRNVFIENCKISEATSVLYCKSNFDRGGRVENIFIRQITVDLAKDALVRLDTNYKGQRGNFYPPHFKHFILEDITCQTAENYVIYAKNAPGGEIEDILFKNITVQHAKIPLFFEAVEDIYFENMTINGKLFSSIHDPSAVRTDSLKIGW